MDDFVKKVLNAPEYLAMQRWLDGEPVWPYAKIIEAWPEFEHWHAKMFRDTWPPCAEGDDTIKFRLPKIDQSYMEARVQRTMLRHLWIGAFGFAIPCAELLDELAKHEHVIDVGAGTGYMTKLMRHRGINVIGSDPGLGGHGFQVGALDPQQVKAGAKDMVSRHPTSAVFCSWPTLKATWFREMLKAMRTGQHLIVIREGACAEDTAWEYLDASFTELGTITIPTFEHMHDYAWVGVKRRPPKSEA